MIEVNVVGLLILIGLVFFFMLVSGFLWAGGLPALKNRCKSRVVEVIIDDQSFGRAEKIDVYLRFSPPRMVKEAFPAGSYLRLETIFRALYPDFVISIVSDQRDKHRRVFMLREKT